MEFYQVKIVVDDSIVRMTTDEDTEEDEDAEQTSLPERYNNTTVVFTGIPKAEWGLYDTENNELVLFNRATGKITKKIPLGDDAPKIGLFCFAYTNGTIFLFDKDARAWYGYK